MKPVPLSKMRDSVVIQSRSLAADSYGGQTPAWSDVATVPGYVEPLSGREAWQVAQVRPDVTHRVTIRYYAGLTPKHRLQVDGRTFNIESVVDVENRHRQHELMCKEQL